jgi:hypothetical protein
VSTIRSSRIFREAILSEWPNLGIKPALRRKVLLAVVQQSCHDTLTFGFRLPLKRIHMAWGWNKTPRCAGLSNCCHYWPAGGSMSPDRLLGTIFARYCFYPSNRLTTEPASSIQLKRCSTGLFYHSQRKPEMQEMDRGAKGWLQKMNTLHTYLVHAC